MDPEFENLLRMLEIRIAQNIRDSDVMMKALLKIASQKIGDHGIECQCHPCIAAAAVLRI